MRLAPGRGSALNFYSIGICANAKRNRRFVYTRRVYEIDLENTPVRILSSIRAVNLTHLRGFRFSFFFPLRTSYTRGFEFVIYFVLFTIQMPIHISHIFAYFCGL